MAQNQPLHEQFDFGSGDRVPSELRMLTRAIEARLSNLEEVRATVEETERQLREVVLTRINDVLLPAIERILQVTELGFLVAHSASSMILNSGTKTLAISEAEAPLWIPSLYVSIERENDINTRGIMRRISYDNDQGVFIGEIVFAEGDTTGTFNDWVLSATPGVTNISTSAMTRAEQAAAIAESVQTTLAAIQTTVDLDRVAAQEAREAAEAAAAAAAESASTATGTDLTPYMKKTDNLSGLSSYTTARSNLGLTSTAVTALATATEVRARSASRVVTADVLWAVSDIGILTWGATVTPNFSLASNFRVTLAGTTALGAPTNAKVGQSGVIEILQDATGNRTLSIPAATYKFTGGVVPTISTAANSRDLLSYYVYQTSPSVLLACSLLKDVR